MDVQFLITCQLGNLLMLLGEITCWSFLRVIGLNDHSVFFFSVFQKWSYESTCRFSQHQWISYCQYVKIFGPTPDLFVRGAVASWLVLLLTQVYRWVPANMLGLTL